LIFGPFRLSLTSMPSSGLRSNNFRKAPGKWGFWTSLHKVVYKLITNQFSPITPSFVRNCCDLTRPTPSETAFALGINMFVYFVLKRLLRFIKADGEGATTISSRNRGESQEPFPQSRKALGIEEGFDFVPA